MIRNRIHQRQHARDLILGQQIDLKIQIRSLISNFRNPVLADQYECGEQNRFQRHDHRQQIKRIRIERFEAGPSQVDGQPDAKPYQVDVNENHVAREPGHPVGDAVLGAFAALHVLAVAIPTGRKLIFRIRRIQ